MHASQMQLSIIEYGAKGAPFIRSEVLASDKLYYRKQMQLSIIEYGAKGAPFIRSEVLASDKLYYKQKYVRIQCEIF